MTTEADYLRRPERAWATEADYDILAQAFKIARDDNALGGRTNNDLKLNRLRLYRARLEVDYFTHITTGGKLSDDRSVSLRKGMASLAKEIAANEGFAS